MDVKDDGWDCQVALADGWLWRGPRRPEVTERLRLEAMLLPWLAPHLPLPVPRPEIRTEDPLRVRHRAIPGVPCRTDSRDQGEALGAFLTALHGVDVADAEVHGARSAGTCAAERAAHHDRFAAEVVRVLPPAARTDALALLMRLVQADYPPVLTHGDLTADHVLVEGDAIGGVIDWLDAGVYDPALDLAWPLHVAPAQFAEGVRASYVVDEALDARARDMALRAPLYTVLRGLDTDDPAVVDAGAGTFVERLAARA